MDTQNFENFDEEGASNDPGGRRWRKGADPDFVCFTYKNMKAVSRDEGVISEHCEMSRFVFPSIGNVILSCVQQKGS